MTRRPTPPGTTLVALAGLTLLLTGWDDPPPPQPPPPAPEANAELDDLLAGAERLLREGKLDDALARYEQAVTLAPARGEAWIGRGRVKLAKNDLPGAHADLDEALELLPKEGLAYFERGRVRMAQGDVGGAIEDYGRAIELQPDPLRAWVARGWARLTFGDYEGAISDYDAAEKLDPDDPHVFLNRARARFEHGELDAALADVDKALKIDPRSAQALLARAIVRARKGDAKALEPDLQAILQSAPDDAQARYTVGSIRGFVGDAAGALADYTAIIDAGKSPPATIKALNNRAVLHAQAGRLDQALADLDRVLTIRPLGMTYSNRAWVRALKGELDVALQDYDRAVQAEKGRAPYALRGRAFVRALKANDAGAAMADLRQATEQALATDRLPAAWSLRDPEWDRLASLAVTSEVGAEELLDSARAGDVASVRRERVARSHGLLGLLLEAGGKRDEAMEHYRAAVADGPDYLLEVRWAKQRVDARR